MHTRLRLFALGLCAAMFSPAVEAAVAADEVKALPGWDGSLPSRHYSGYLPVRGGQSFMHYYLQVRTRVNTAACGRHGLSCGLSVGLEP